MRFASNKDKIEAISLNRRTDGRFSWLLFPSYGTAFTDKISVLNVLQRAWVFPVLFCLLIPLLITVVGIAITADLSMRLYQHIRWDYIDKITMLALMDVLRGLPIVFACILTFNIWLHMVIRWAWNRRADRLNREPNVSQPVVALVPGIWPPAPIVPAASNPEPKL